MIATTNDREKMGCVRRISTAFFLERLLRLVRQKTEHSSVEQQSLKGFFAN